MKKLISLIAAVGMISVGSTAMAGTAAQTGVNGSFHDITYLGATNGATNTTGQYKQDDFQRVCIFCHTPHNANGFGEGSLAPLWNHDLSTLPAASAYTWAAPANQNIQFASDSLIGPSRLCLSCHDGITAVDAHGPDSTGTAANGPNGSQGTTAMSSPGRFFGEAGLAGTHPIGFRYSDAITQRTVNNNNGTAELRPITSLFLTSVTTGASASLNNTQVGSTVGLITAGSVKTIQDTLYSPGTNGQSGYVTCASCHDVHNTNNAKNAAALSGDYTPNYFVWAPEAGSALCLSCHVK